MGAATFSPLPGRRDTLSGTLLFSIFLHGFLFFAAFAYTLLGLRLGGGWGNDWGSSAMRVSAVSSLPGVPLPAPMLATINTVANQNPGVYQSEPQTPPPPTPHTVDIPKFQQEIKPEKVTRANKRIQKQIVEPPTNAVPFGEGGRPSMTTGQFANAAGQGEMNFGKGNFGERYGWYVNAVRTRISSNWLLSTISPNILTAPRVYLTFDISRDGSIVNVEVTQSSGIPEVDRSAIRAVLASNPLGPLPPDYPGGKVSVDFYFDFHRR
jgi:TonB family protein